MKKRFALLLILLLLPCWAIAEGNNTTIITNTWNIGEYADEFDLPTGEYYLTTEPIVGTFSNSVTTKEDVKACVYWTEMEDSTAGRVFIKLFEYGTYPVNNSGSKTKYYDVVMMDVAGNKYTLVGYMLAGSDRIYFDDSKHYPMYKGTNFYVTDNLLVGNKLLGVGTIRFSITERNDSLTRYVITFENAGFSDAKKTLKEMSGK